MAGPKVLVTGGTGFVGSTIVNLLHQRHPEYDIHITDIKGPAPIWPLRGNFPFYQAAISDSDAVFKVVGQVEPDVVIHAAGIVPARNARYGQEARDLAFRVNVDGTKNILKAAEVHAVKAFIYTSSECVVIDDMDHDYPNVDETEPLGNATLIYGQSKVSSTTYLAPYPSTDIDAGGR